MKQLLTLLSFCFILIGCKNENKETSGERTSAEVEETSEDLKTGQDSTLISIDPVSHATAVITWDDVVFYIDPTGGAEAFKGKENPGFVLISDIHGDHTDVETLKALNLGITKIIVPSAVKELLPKEMHGQLIVLNNGETTDLMGFKIEAIPMYNLPESQDAFHPKGRGNGYLLEKDGKRLYLAGDTEDIPEMQNLKNIELALVPMNMPYTMTVDQAAEGVLAFKPKTVVPYHYRGKDGLADVEKFKELVNKGNKDIEVRLMDWYPIKE
jgi:L-ascorbate metabolism protein UlaG (beta-lactamase superfamily)